MVWKWHFADEFTKPEKLLRAATTSRYGVYSICYFLVFLMVISLINVFGPQLHRRYTVLKYLEREHNAGLAQESSNTLETDRAGSRLAQPHFGSGINKTLIEGPVHGSSVHSLHNGNGPSGKTGSGSEGGNGDAIDDINNNVNVNNNYTINDNKNTILNNTHQPSWLSKLVPVYTCKLPSHAISFPLIPVVGFWSFIFLILILNETQYEYTYLAKRLGRVPVALLPPVYFLTLKPSPLPQTFYLQLVPFHKWLSRLVFVMLVAHGLVYIYIYIVLNKLAKLGQLTNVSGIVAFFFFVAMVLTSLKPIRRRFYNTVFYPVHYILSWGCLPLIYFHSRNTTYPYVYASLGILVLQMLYRFKLSQRGVRLPVQYISSTMLFVSIPRAGLSQSFQKYFTPGSHLRISSSLMPMARIKSMIPFGRGGQSHGGKSLTVNGSVVSSLVQSTHPYTIASLPQDPNIMLCIRKTRYPIKLNRAYTIEGPYYSSLPSPYFDDVSRGRVKRVLFVAGGTGIAFCAPLMRHLRGMNVAVKLVWAIRDMNDAKALQYLGLEQAALQDKQVEVYVTRSAVLGNSDGLRDGMFQPQTVDEGLVVSIDDKWCDGGESRGMGAQYDEESALQRNMGMTYGSVDVGGNSYNDNICNDSTSHTIQGKIMAGYSTTKRETRDQSYMKRALDTDFTSIMINSRPVLNLRLKSWLYGVGIDTDWCCCLDQLFKPDGPKEQEGRWVLASGGAALVSESERWAIENGFSFHKDEFSL